MAENRSQRRLKKPKISPFLRQSADQEFAQLTVRDRLYLARSILRTVLDDLPSETKSIGETIDQLTRITYRLEVDAQPKLPIEYQGDIRDDSAE